MPLPTLSQVHVQAALTNLSVAYRQDLNSVVDRLFPQVVVNKQSDKYFEWSKADMWRAEARERAPGADFPRVGIRLSTNTYYARQYALEYAMPDEILANQDAAVDLEMTGTQYLTEQHMLKKDLVFAANYFTTGVWTSGTVSTAWDNVSSGTPVTNVTDGVQRIRRALGASSAHKIVGLGGAKIRTALLTSDQVRDRTKYVMAQTQQALEASLAGVLGLDELILSDREYNTKPEKVTASYSPVFDNDFLILAVPRSPGLNTPAAGYSFEWNEGGMGPMYVEMYRDDPRKQDVLRSVCYYDLKLVASDLGVFFNNCVS